MGRGGRLLRPLLGWGCAAFALGHVASTIEVGALPLAHRFVAGPDAASVLVAVFCVGSVLESLGYAASNYDGTAPTAALLLAVMAAGGTVVALGGSWALVLVGVALASPASGRC